MVLTDGVFVGSTLVWVVVTILHQQFGFEADVSHGETDPRGSASWTLENAVKATRVRHTPPANTV